MNICYDTDNNYNFDGLTLGNPKSLQGGAYFSKVKLNNDNTLIFQTPKFKIIEKLRIGESISDGSLTGGRGQGIGVMESAMPVKSISILLQTAPQRLVRIFIFVQFS